MSSNEVLNEVSSPQHHQSITVDYGAAYRELYEQLCSRMIHRIMRFFYELYAKIGDVQRFKIKLVNIQRWNSAQINHVARGFVRNHKDIIRVFRLAYAANVLVMSVVVQRDEQSTDVEIDCPKFSDFVHRCFIETSRNLYNHGDVLDPNLSPAEKMHVKEDLYKSIARAIATSLRMMVPIHKITPIKPEDEEQYKVINGEGQEDQIDISDTEIIDDRDEEEIALLENSRQRYSSIRDSRRHLQNPDDDDDEEDSESSENSEDEDEEEEEGESDQSEDDSEEEEEEDDEEDEDEDEEDYYRSR